MLGIALLILCMSRHIKVLVLPGGFSCSPIPSTNHSYPQNWSHLCRCNSGKVANTQSQSQSWVKHPLLLTTCYLDCVTQAWGSTAPVSLKADWKPWFWAPTPALPNLRSYGSVRGLQQSIRGLRHSASPHFSLLEKREG